MTPEQNNLLAQWRAIFRPAEPLNAWQWAERNVNLVPPIPTPFPGPYRSQLTPYVRGPMEAFTDPAIHTIVIVWATQSGKTQNVIVIPLLYAIATDAGPAVLIEPSADMGRSFSETRFQPMTNACPAVHALLPDDPDKFKLLEMHFRTCTLNIVGSNSPANLAQRPVRYLFADEIDKYPPASSREADALSLALERSKAFWNRKIVLTSTPTTPLGNIWRWFERSDKRKLLVPCPHCGEFQELVFENIRWPGKEEAKIRDLGMLAWYECVKCAKPIKDTDKPAMLRAGRWEATAEANGVAGFHLNALYVPWVTFGEVAKEFLRSKRFIDQFQNFTNSWLALPWDAVEQAEKNSAMTVNTEILATHTNSYRRNQIPAGCVFLTCGIDVQAHEVWYVVRGWGRDEASWLISWGKVAVETDEPQAFLAAVKSILAQQYSRPILKGCIDSGWGKNTAAVYDIVRQIPLLVATKGRRTNRSACTDGKEIPLPPPQLIDRKPDRTPLRGSVALYSPSTSYFKRWMFGRINADPPCWFVPDDLRDSADGQIYLRHLASERETTERSKKTGTYSTFWVVRMGYNDNHLLDCEMLSSVARHIIMTGKSMERLDESLKSYKPPQVQAAQTSAPPQKPQVREPYIKRRYPIFDNWNKERYR